MVKEEPGKINGNEREEYGNILGMVWGMKVKIKGKCLGKSRPVKFHRAIIIMGENRLKVLKRE